jgi:tetratricopeptide (TPR) repeat protein
MKKHLWLCLYLPFALQAQTSAELLEEGKSLFKNSDRHWENPKEAIEKFKTAQSLFEKVLAIEPNNAEAHYYNGYAIDRINSVSMNEKETDLIHSYSYIFADIASREFEWVLTHDSTYRGEKHILNPAGKLTSIWGSLALNYLKIGKKDSCVWAFEEGKRRGGFTEQFVEFGKNMLKNCPQNAVLFTWGDGDTYPLWYAQYVEKYRTDVAVVNLSLIQVGWFIKLVKNEWQVPFGKTDAEIDTLPEYFLDYTGKEIVVKVNSMTGKKQPPFKWLLMPSQETYLFKSDFIISEFIKANQFRRPVCYALTTNERGRQNLNRFLTQRGLILEVLPNVKPAINNESLNRLKKLSFNALYRPSTLLDDDNLTYSSSVQYAFQIAAQGAVDQKNKKLAQEIMNAFEAQLPEKDVPRNPILSENIKILLENIKKMK